MAFEMRLDLKLAQKLVMTPQLQQAIKLLQLSRLELSQVLYQEMLENPVLEDVTIEPDAEDADSQSKDEAQADGEDTGAVDVFDLKWDNYLEEDEGPLDRSSFVDSEENAPSYDQTISSPSTLSDHLMWQLRLTPVTKAEGRAAEVIIGNIDEDGYFRDVSLDEVAEEARVSPAVALKALGMVQELDPPGVAARDLRECLLIQARQLGLEGTIVEAIIKDHMEYLEKKRYPAIARALKVPVKEVVLAATAVESLEPKPGRPFTASEVQYVVPDVFVVKKAGEYVILLNDDGMPKLRISPFYKTLMRGKNDDATRDYVESRLRSAQWLIKSIEQRNKTIFRVAESIVARQRDFLESGMDHIKPMILRDVAEDISMHESTISRVTTNKYMHCPQGIFELKYFFAGGISATDGESMSSITVRGMVQKTISEEDPKKPYNDKQLVDILGKRNINIARRTVAKYRFELNIPPANVRRKTY